MTNYEKITSMNKDDLSDFLIELILCNSGENCEHCPLVNEDECSFYNIKLWMDKENKE